MSTDITLRTHANTSDIHKHHSYTPIPPHRHPSHYQDISRQQKKPTHINTHQLTSTDTFSHLQTTWEGLGMSGTHLGVSVGEFVSVNFNWCMNCVWVLGYWIVFGWCLWMFTVFGCVWGVILVLISCRVENLHCFDKDLKVNIFFTWPYWDIKISKCPDISLTKMVGFCLFLVVLFLSERN